MNNIDDDVEPYLGNCLSITDDEFGITLSSNKLSDELVESLHQKIFKQHGHNKELAVQQAEAEGKPFEESKVDPNISMKRLAV
jgi:hypothetical protein